MKNNSNKIISRKKGIVINAKNDRTVIVLVYSFKTHPKYKKKYKFTKKYKAHDENKKCKIGDKVEIISCRPISKDKNYKVV